LIYLRQEGRGIGLLKKLQAYNLQDQGLDTIDANLQLGHLPDERHYDIAALILTSLQVTSIALITNNPLKIDALVTLGIPVTQRIAIETPIHADNVGYLKTKVERMQHLLEMPPAAE
jgi:GTP cyclohydrolase II